MLCGAYHIAWVRVRVVHFVCDLFSGDQWHKYTRGGADCREADCRRDSRKQRGKNQKQRHRCQYYSVEQNGSNEKNGSCDVLDNVFACYLLQYLILASLL